MNAADDFPSMFFRRTPQPQQQSSDGCLAAMVMSLSQRMTMLEQHIMTLQSTNDALLREVLTAYLRSYGPPGPGAAVTATPAIPTAPVTATHPAPTAAALPHDDDVIIRHGRAGAF